MLCLRRARVFGRGRAVGKRGLWPLCLGGPLLTHRDTAQDECGRRGH